LIAVILVVVCVQPATHAAAADEVRFVITSSPYASELATVAALGDLTNAPVMRADDTTMATTNVSPGETKAIFFDALDYTGSSTRVYAYLGIPAGASAGSPVPGVVLVHGGGGSASSSWVAKWTDRGYAAISLAVEGQTDEKVEGSWVKHAMAGPARGALYNDSPDSLTNQWMYHAVADCVLANSLLRSLPEVDADKVGLTGYSWGGVITSTAIGIDNRFQFAIPTYGCGHLYDSRNYYGHNLADNESYRNIWDPMIRITNATMPVLWFSWPQEPHFLMDSLAYTYHGAAGPRMVSLKPGMGHGGNYDSPESYDFADSIVNTGSPWCEQQSLILLGNTATVAFTSTKDLNSASLVYTTGNDEPTSGIDTNLEWTEAALSAPVEAPAGTWTVTATLPGNVTGWFINAKATGSDTNGLYGYNDVNLTVSSDYRENIDVILNPADALVIEHLLADDQTSGMVNMSYAGPANVEISSIAIGGQSHAGAFTTTATAPMVLNYPSPVMTPISIQFDNTVAGLTNGQTAAATMTIVWDNLDGSTDQIQLPVSAIAIASRTVVYDVSDLWSSRQVNAGDDVIIRNGANVTVGEVTPTNLIVNGSFEPPDSPDIAYNGIASYAAGNTSLTGWTIADTSVWLIDGWDRFGNETNTVASDGDQYLQLQDSGTGVATISQDITTEVGAMYELTFDYSGVDTSSHSVDLTYGVGGPVQTVTYSTGTPMLDWQTETFRFQAASTTTTITLTGYSVGGGFYGVGVDNVSVMKVPTGNVIVNGSFETPDIPGEFAAHGPGGGVNGWTISGTGVVLVAGFDNFDAWEEPSVASDGDQYLQLQTHLGGAGTISQGFATAVGQRYTLTFGYSGIYPGPKTTSFTYDVGGPVQTVNVSIASNQAPWETETFEFEAVASSTTISFTGKKEAGFWGSSIDNVSVAAVAGAVETADTLVVNDGGSPTNAILTIDEAFNLTVTTSMELGAGTGAGIVNQSTGTVTTSTLTINSSGTGDASQYNLSGGGTLTATGIVVKASGELNLTGGSLNTTPVVQNHNALQIDSGGLVAISGGTHDIYGRIWNAGTLRVIGNASTIAIHQIQGGLAGTYEFILDSDGVSTLADDSWVALDGVTISVAGTAYSGGNTNILLFDSQNLVSTSTTVNVTGFDGARYAATVTQDQAADEVMLVITETQYGSWISGYGLGSTNANMQANPDGDYWPNLMEYALGGVPTDGFDSGIAPTVQLSSGGFDYIYRRRLDAAARGLTYTVEARSNLLAGAAWSADGCVETGSGAIDASFERVTNRVDTGDTGFVRLKVGVGE